MCQCTGKLNKRSMEVCIPYPFGNFQKFISMLRSLPNTYLRTILHRGCRRRSSVRDSTTRTHYSRPVAVGGPWRFSDDEIPSKSFRDILTFFPEDTDVVAAYNAHALHKASFCGSPSPVWLKPFWLKTET